MIKAYIFFLSLVYSFFSIAVIHAQFDTALLSSVVTIEQTRIELENPYKSTDDYGSFFSFSSKKFTKQNNISTIFGTGIIIKKEQNTYYILSNYHVVKDADDLWITFYDGTFIQGTLYSADKDNDLAIISFESDQEYPIASLQKNRDITIGETVYAIGHPYGFPFTVTEGIISGLDRSSDTIQGLFIQTDATLNPGNSGGPIVNRNGEVIGISTWVFSIFDEQELGLNFAIDVFSISHIISQLIAKKTIEHSWLGITVQIADIPMLHTLTINNRNAVIISNIFSHNTYILDTLQIGDVIIAIDNQPLNTVLSDNYSSIFSIIANKHINAPVHITLMRDNKTMQVTTTTALRPQQKTFKDIQASLWPGYITTVLPQNEKQTYGLESTEFALFVDDVYEFTAAEEAGLEYQDIILDINNQNIQSYYNYFRIINNALLQGHEIHLKILRNGSNIEHILFLPPILENNTIEQYPIINPT